MDTLAIPRLPVGRYRIEFFADTPVDLGDFPGSPWRGALGHALRRTVCVARGQECKACMLYRSCAYPYLFQTPVPETAPKMRRYETAPPPYVIDAPAHTDATLHYPLELTLIGIANHHFPIVLHALRQAAGSGRGIAGHRLRLGRVAQETAPGSGEWLPIYEDGGALTPSPPAVMTIPPCPQHVGIRLHTPLRLKRDGRHVGPGDFRFADLFGNLLRRISLLTCFHTDVPLETDFKSLVTQAKEIGITHRLTWKEQSRYSARQKTRMQYGGLLGDIELREQAIAPFWPYLWIGQWVHAGSGVTMGLGAYRLTASLPAKDRSRKAPTIRSTGGREGTTAKDAREGGPSSFMELQGA